MGAEEEGEEGGSVGDSGVFLKEHLEAQSLYKAMLRRMLDYEGP